MPIHMTGKPKPKATASALKPSAGAATRGTADTGRETFKMCAQYVELTGTSTPWIQKKSKKKEGAVEIKIYEEQTVDQLRQQIIQLFGNLFAAWEVDRCRQTGEKARELGQNVRIYYKNKPLRFTRRDGKLEVDVTLAESGLRNHGDNQNFTVARADASTTLHWMLV